MRLCVQVIYIELNSMIILKAFIVDKSILIEVATWPSP